MPSDLGARLAAVPAVDLSETPATRAAIDATAGWLGGDAALAM